MPTEIKTDKSFLVTTQFDDMKLLEQSVKEIENLLLEKQRVFVYGRWCYQHRSIGFFSDTSVGYKYSGNMVQSQPMLPFISKLLETVNKHFDSNFNGILVNRYENGSDYIGVHSDDEKSLDKAGGVVAISFGQTRKFRIRNKKDKKIFKDIKLTSGMLLQMGGEFQSEFTHEIPIEKLANGVRYSFTFRNHNE